MNDDTPSRTLPRFFDFALAVLLTCGYGAPPLLVIASLAAGWVGAASLLVAFVAGLVLLMVVYRATLAQRARAALAARVLVLGILPAWGLVYSHFAAARCVVNECALNDTVFRPFAEPQIFGLVALHLLTVVAYAISRRRPGPLRPFGEALVHALLLVGVVAHTIVGVQVGPWNFAGVLLPPVFLPCIAPAITVFLYGTELLARLRRRGAEAETRAPYTVLDSRYRTGPEQRPLAASPRIDRKILARALLLAPALLGIHAVIQALWLGPLDAALSVFTSTCGYPLSRIDVTVTPGSCHYLCTVAARGHAALVRPERIGRRGGVPIVVNRQLALANAFEDLLHERWPRFGRLARDVYTIGSASP